MDLRLRDKVALVTGSSRGIGLATAKAFAAEGCRIMLSARSTEQLRETETNLAEPAVHIAARLGAQYRWHATMCCEAASLRTGVSTAQRGIACGQRGWKRHPEGGLSALGTSPVIASF